MAFVNARIDGSWQVTLSSTGTTTISFQIPGVTGQSIHISKITHVHHVAQTNNPFVTILDSTTPIWRTRVPATDRGNWDFFSPLVITAGNGVTITATSSAAAQTIAVMVQFARINA